MDHMFSSLALFFLFNEWKETNNTYILPLRFKYFSWLTFTSKLGFHKVVSISLFETIRFDILVLCLVTMGLLSLTSPFSGIMTSTDICLWAILFQCSMGPFVVHVTVISFQFSVSFVAR